MKDCLEEDDKGLELFINTIRKLNESRNHKVKNSYGIYDGYKYYRRNKPKDAKYILTESQYFAITRRINNILAEELSNGNDITLPCSLGRLELRKFNARVELINNKIKTNLPIDWDKTLKLWYEDEEAFKNKTLIKMEEKEIFKIHYNRVKADYNNKSFYQFDVNRGIKKRLKINIKEGIIDAFNL